jgi:ssRNA-specific RNase YbeY (16S rRNA maturation enzyme)
VQMMTQAKAIHCDLSIFFTHNSYMKVLNRTLRNIDEPTDILSFPATEVGLLCFLVFVITHLLCSFFSSHIFS